VTAKECRERIVTAAREVIREELFVRGRGSGQAADVLQERRDDVSQHGAASEGKSVRHLTLYCAASAGRRPTFSPGRKCPGQGRGTVATGKIEQGDISLGQKVEIFGLGDVLESVCLSVETFNRPLDQGKAGMNFGLLLRGIKSDGIQRGSMLPPKPHGKERST